jgi:hypothetical protein
MPKLYNSDVLVKNTPEVLQYQYFALNMPEEKMNLREFYPHEQIVRDGDMYLKLKNQWRSDVNDNARTYE